MWADLRYSGAGLQGGNTAEPVSFELSATGSGVYASAPVQVSVLDSGNRDIGVNLQGSSGNFAATYKPAVQGNYDVVVVFRVHAGVTIETGTDSKLTRVYGPGLEDGVQDKIPTFFNIEAYGTDGKRMTKGGDKFSVKIVGPEGEDVPAKLTDNKDGTYRCDYAAVNAGPTRINVLLRGTEHVAASPYTVNVRAGADHNNSSVEEFWFKINARTKRGAPLGRGGESFTVDISGPAGPVATKLTDNNDGTLTATYKVPVPATGKYTFSVKVNGQDIRNSPWTADF